MDELKGKVALVTGGSRGIGRGISQHLARSGATVIINYTSDVNAATEVVEAIAQEGGKALAFRADISRVGEIRYLFDEILLQFDRLDIVVANAGIQVHQAITSTTEADFDRVFAINAICPGPVETDFLTATETSESLDILAKLAPAGRLGMPNDIADVTVFLASNAAQWITGQCIRVNGGFA
jgi:NAD(P)-dependent dehydrogenase (short-subunit alcohol dehydrogenase family)